MNRYRIFISSTIDDLAAARAGVEEELRAMEIFDPILVENLPASGEASRRVCLREVAEADAIVLILKDRYGFVPDADNPEGLSVTHLEYREAKRLMKPVFAFLLDGAQPQPALASFIQEVSDFDQGVLRKKWSTTGELREAVRRALLFWIARRAREIGSDQAKQQAARELERHAKFGRFPVVSDRESFQDDAQQSWRETLLDQLRVDCRRRLLPAPYLRVQSHQDDHQSGLSLEVRAASPSGRLALLVGLIDRPDDSSLPGPVEVDAALTVEGARFAAQLCLAFVLVAADDWSAGVDQLLRVSRHRSCSNQSRARLLATAAYVSAANQGQRVAEIVRSILELPKLDSPVVSAAVMALVSAELRLEHARAQHALRKTQQLALQLLTTALQRDPTAAENLYNLARHCLGLEAAVAVTFYSELARADPSYEERWYFHRDLGLIYYHKGQHGHAARHYDRACHLKDNDSELFRFAGDAYYYRGYWAEALIRYERALAIEPIESHFLDAKIELCRARLRAGRDRDPAFQRKRDLSHRFSRLGLRAAEAGRRWLARPLFRTATRLCDVNHAAESWLALYANRRGAYAEAIAHLKSALAAVPEDPSTRLNLVMNLIFQNEGQFTDCARTHAKTAIFHGGPETIDRFHLRLLNTENKSELCEKFGEIFEVVRCERDQWVERRREVLKPEMFGGVMHIEFRP
ncbi:MAG: DUF4062 domain-containing protein [bacterium]